MALLDLVYDKFSKDEKEAITLMIKSLPDINVINITNGLSYIEEISKETTE